MPKNNRKENKATPKGRANRQDVGGKGNTLGKEAKENPSAKMVGTADAEGMPMDSAASTVKDTGRKAGSPRKILPPKKAKHTAVPLGSATDVSQSTPVPM